MLKVPKSQLTKLLCAETSSSFINREGFRHRKAACSRMARLQLKLKCAKANATWLLDKLLGQFQLIGIPHASRGVSQIAQRRCVHTGGTAEERNILQSVVDALGASDKHKTLIVPLLKQVSELELSKQYSVQHAEDRLNWLKERSGLEHKIWNAKYQQTLRDLGEAHLRMLEASHQLHCRGVIEFIQQDQKDNLDKVLSRRPKDLPRPTRKQVWEIMKPFLMDVRGKNLFELEMNGKKLVPEEGLEKAIEIIYDRTSRSIHEFRNTSGVVIIDSSSLSPSETDVMKGLCELYMLPWRLYQGPEVVEHNAPTGWKTWSGQYDQLSD